MPMNESLKLILERLQARDTLQTLSPAAVWEESLEADIQMLSFPTPTSASAVDRTMFALKAGLHLRNDSLDRSHSYSQEIEDDATGCYWHGIMHRMEGDYWNANYWFRSAGTHPVKARLQERVPEYLRSEVNIEALPEGSIRDLLMSIRDGDTWKAPIFTDAVQRQESGTVSGETRAILEYIQHIEISELLAYTVAAAANQE
ncbi:hypothetical protein KZ483_08220 [Paenibacillus sp. sptzw28]|uniref:hypothetical protein n=1 Tax=Paenibacillus sp. sptzw28 TaxID=715179 RepID=UPI001C6F50BB|nr:hypothetical protein [Paenibacillus sp. sptzw28]QYR22903.1 hypothetical protein KZ483_08220 [Paenibacillus sp. sptzw28]